jgi:hypothetical protein
VAFAVLAGSGPDLPEKPGGGGDDGGGAEIELPDLPASGDFVLVSKYARLEWEPVLDI